MRIPRALVLCAAMSLVTTGCGVKHRVYPVNGDLPATVHGVQYALPQTLVTIDIPVVRTVVTKGEFYDTAAAKEIDLEPLGVSYRLGTVKLGTRARPDPDARYLVAVEGGTFEERALALELTEAGLMTSANSRADDKRLDAAVKTLEIAAGIAGRFAFGAPPEGHTPASTTADDLVRALKELRADRQKLVVGKQALASVPPETLERMLKEIGEIEESILSRFRTVQVTTWTPRAEICLAPGDLDAGPVRRELLFLPARDPALDHGLVAGRDSGIVVPPSFIPPSDQTDAPQGSKAPERSAVVVTLTREGAAVSDAGTFRAERGKPSGFFYRLPAPVLVTVTRDENPLAADRAMVAQLGPICCLPVSPGGDASEYRLAVYPDSGSIKSLTVSSTAATAAPAEGLGRAAGSLLDANAAANDELKALEREQKILEAQKKIRDLRLELGGAD